MGKEWGQRIRPAGRPKEIPAVAIESLKAFQLLGSNPARIVFLAWSNAEAFVGKTPPQEKTDNATQ